jgi:hypothetical protein
MVVSRFIDFEVMRTVKTLASLEGELTHSKMQTIKYFKKS